MLTGLSACGNLTPNPAPTKTIPADSKAEGMIRSGDFPGAIKRYETLAQSSPTPDHYRLEAADAALRSGDGAQATRLASAINSQQLTKEDQNSYLLLSSRLDLNEGKAQTAINKLNGVAVNELKGHDAKNYHILRASALNQLGDMLGCVKERIELGALLNNADESNLNNQAILDALEHLPGDQLNKQQALPPDVLEGWLSLARLLKMAPQEARLHALKNWQTQFPNHPASGDFARGQVQNQGMPGTSDHTNTPSLPKVDKSAGSLPAGSFIGVMLPDGGAYSSQSQAVRTGLLAAQEAAKSNGKKLLPLHFPDSSQNDVYKKYRLMADGGATAIIGPLTKDDLTTLAAGGDLPIPILALNQTDSVQNPQITQFGLSPEQELEQVVDRARSDGKLNALVLVPDTSFGRRLAKHLASYLPSTGGHIIAVRSYIPDGKTNVYPFEGLPADAGDSYLLFIANTEDARSIMGALSAQKVTSTAYTISHAWDGRGLNPSNQILNGLVICDMPLLLNPASGSNPAMNSSDKFINESSADSVRLIAFGMDAYNLTTELPRIKSDTGRAYQGATGMLNVQADNRIKRQLVCARFRGSQPEIY